MWLNSGMGDEPRPCPCKLKYTRDAGFWWFVSCNIQTAGCSTLCDVSTHTLFRCSPPTSPAPTCCRAAPMRHWSYQARWRSLPWSRRRRRRLSWSLRPGWWSLWRPSEGWRSRWRTRTICGHIYVGRWIRSPSHCLFLITVVHHLCHEIDRIEEIFMTIAESMISRLPASQLSWATSLGGRQLLRLNILRL